MSHLFLLRTAMLLPVLLGSCFVAKSEILPDEQYHAAATVGVDQKIGVMQPKDPSYADEHYPGSGLILSNRVKEALHGSAKEVVMLGTDQLDEAIRICENNGVQFIIRPIIQHWEDRATNWSGLPDKIALELILIDSPGGGTLNSLLFNASSTFFTFTNQPPEHMLDDSFETAVQQLLSRDG